MFEYEWTDGRTNDHWLRVGLNEEVAHVFQTPWTEKTWWVETEFKSIVKQGFSNVNEAKVAAEKIVRDWLGRANYQTPNIFDFCEEPDLFG